MTSADAETLRAAYLAMELTSRHAIVPLAVASLLTGLVMSLGTKWGLFRHYWVLISLILIVLATLVLLSEIRTISYLSDGAADPTTSIEDLRSLGGTLPHSVGGIGVAAGDLGVEHVQTAGNDAVRLEEAERATT